MAIAITPKSTWTYQLKEDRLENGETDDTGTTFELGYLSMEEDARITDSVVKAAGDGGISYLSGTQAKKTLLAGLRGWENFNNASGEAVEFKTSGQSGAEGVRKCKPENLDLLTPGWRTELSNAITRGSSVTTEESD